MIYAVVLHLYYPVQGSCVRSADCRSTGFLWLSQLPTVGLSLTTGWRTSDLWWNQQQWETNSVLEVINNNFTITVPMLTPPSLDTSCHCLSGMFYWHWHPRGRWSWILQLSPPKCPHLCPSPFPHSICGKQEKEENVERNLEDFLTVSGNQLNLFD